MRCLGGNGAAALTYLVVIGSIIGFGAFVWINHNTSGTVSSSFSYVSPVDALALSVWLLDKTVTVAKVAAGAVSLIGVASMISGENDRKFGRS
jgi:drug/metabolite transporter (DMT)-like permease